MFFRKQKSKELSTESSFALTEKFEGFAFAARHSDKQFSLNQHYMPLLLDEIKVRRYKAFDH
jgi:hypothetical protein